MKTSLHDGQRSRLPSSSCFTPKGNSQWEQVISCMDLPGQERARVRDWRRGVIIGWPRGERRICYGPELQYSVDPMKKMRKRFLAESIVSIR